MSLYSMFTDMSNELVSIMQRAEVLYAVYFFAFFFAVWTLYNLGLQNTKQFKGKPAKVIATMLTIITTGAIFYSAGSASDLLGLFHGFIGFIIILFFALIAAGAGIWGFIKNKDSEKPNVKRLAMIYLSLGLYIASSLLVPPFSPNESSRNFFQPNPTYGGYINNLTGSLGIFYDILTIVQAISLLLLVVNLVMLAFDALGGNSTHSTNNDKPSKTVEEKKRSKEIAQAKEYIKNISHELRELNNHFNMKMNLLNELRRRIGNYRQRGGN